MKVTVAFVVLACCVFGEISGQSEKVSCFVCNTQSTGDCADPFTTPPNNKMLQDGCTMCSKVKQTQNGKQVISRGCESYGTTITVGCTFANRGDDEAKLCYCHTDSCNASTRASMTTSLLFLLPAFLLCLKKV